MRWLLRVPHAGRPGSILRAGPLALLLAASLARADDATGVAKPAGGFGVAATVQYVVNGSGDSRRVLPLVTLGDRVGLSSAPASPRLLSLHYAAEAGATTRPEDRVDLARSLLLPGALGLTLGAAHDLGNSTGTRVVVPEVSVGAKMVPWHADTAAVKVGISGGLEFLSNQAFDASIRLTRALNAVGKREQKRLLAASGSPDLWASDVSATAGFHPRRSDVGLFGAFGAYLFDSKFHVPAAGRRVFTLGVRKAFS